MIRFLTYKINKNAVNSRTSALNIGKSYIFTLHNVYFRRFYIIYAAALYGAIDHLFRRKALLPVPLS